MRYTRGLKFEERPDYNYLRGLMEQVLRANGWALDNKFDWTDLVVRVLYWITWLELCAGQFFLFLSVICLFGMHAAKLSDIHKFNYTTKRYDRRGMYCIDLID